MSVGGALLVALVLLAANAFFVGAEFALVSARRSAVEQRAGTGRAGRITLRAMERVSLLMAGAQLGITVCSLGLGAIAEPAFAHLLEPVLGALQLPESLRHPIAFALEWGVRRMGEQLELRSRSGQVKPVTADVFPAYDEDGGVLVALSSR